MAVRARSELDRVVAALVAGPDRDGNLRGVAAEPQALEVVGGAGLAGDGLVDGEDARQLLGGAAAVGEDRGEDLGGRLGHALVHDAGRVVLVLVDDVAVAVLDLVDGHGVAVQAAAGQGGVGLGHLERGGGVGAEDRGAVGLQVGVDAHRLGRLDHRVDAHGHAHLHVAGVGRDGGGVGERHGAVGLVAEVLHLPGVVHLDGRVAVEHDVGVHAGLERRHEREHLEGRARLLGRSRRGVHLGVIGVGVEVASADHGLDVAGVGVDGHQRAVELAVARLVKHLLDGRLGRVLVGGVDRGVDLQTALDDGVLREVALEHALHVVGPVGVGARAVHVRVAEVQDEVLRLGIVVLLLRDVTAAQHVVEDLVATLLGRVGVHGRVVVGGRVGQADERGGLGQGELAGVLVEVGDARGLDAVGAVAVVDRVEVHQQDLVLGVGLLHLDGDVGLADLTLERLLELLVGQDGVSHELLGDGRGALGAACELREHGSADADGVDAVVGVEAFVLDVDGALPHVLGDLVLRDGTAVLEVEGGDGVALRVIDLAGLGYEVGVGRGVVGQVLQPRLDDGAERHAQRDGEHHHEAEYAGCGEADDVRL